jgi:hypothetical protein
MTVKIFAPAIAISNGGGEKRKCEIFSYKLWKIKIVLHRKKNPYKAIAL